MVCLIFLCCSVMVCPKGTSLRKGEEKELTEFQLFHQVFHQLFRLPIFQLYASVNDFCKNLFNKSVTYFYLINHCFLKLLYLYLYIFVKKCPETPCCLNLLCSLATLLKSSGYLKTFRFISEEGVLPSQRCLSSKPF